MKRIMQKLIIETLKLGLKVNKNKTNYMKMRHGTEEIQHGGLRVGANVMRTDLIV